MPDISKYTKEEHARLGRALYEQQVRSLVEAGNHGRIVAMDVDSGDYELADVPLDAAKTLLSRRPEAQIWCVRIGHAAVYRFGTHVRGTGT